MPISFKLNSLIATIRSAGLLGIGLLVVNIAMLGLYIWHVNATQTSGYTMRALESQIEDGAIELTHLNLEVAKLQSIDSVSTRIQMLGLTKVKNIVYVNSQDSEVAMNR